jgi:hypothetical protein
MINAILILSGVTVIATTMAFLTVWRRRTSLQETWLEAFAWVPGIALAIMSLSVFGTRYFFERWPTPIEVLIGLAVILLTLYVSTLFRKEPTNHPETGTLKYASRFLHVFAIAAVIATTIPYYASSQARPNGSWDAMAIWNMHARSLARSEGSMVEILSEQKASHPEYPHCIPQSVATLLRLSGESPYPAQYLGFLIYLGIVFGLYIAVRRFASSLLGAAAVILLVATPGVVLGAAAQAADISVAYFNLIAAFGLASQFLPGKEKRVPAWLAGFFLGLLPWTKREGMILAAGMFLAFFLVLMLVKEMRGRRLRSLIPILLGATPGVTAFLLLKTGWAPEDTQLHSGFRGVADHIFDGERWRELGLQVKKEVTTGGDIFFRKNPKKANFLMLRWGITWPALGCALLLLTRPLKVLRRSAAHRCITLIVLAQLSGLFILYLTVPERQVWLLETSFHRLLLQIVPVLIFTIFSLSTLGMAKKPALVVPQESDAPLASEQTPIDVHNIE